MGLLFGCLWENLAIGMLLGMALCSLFNTNIRYINGWVESIVLRRKARGFFVMRTGR